MNACQCMIVSVGSWMHQWQSLIGAVVAGSMALLAAWITLSGPKRQIEKAEQIERDRINREILSRRVRLPVILDQACRIQMQCFGILNKYRTQIYSDDFVGPVSLSGAKVDIPVDLLNELSELVAICPDENVAKLVRKIISELGILTSSLSTFRSFMDAQDRADFENSLSVCWMRPMKLTTLVNRLFPYARFREETVSSRVTWEDVRNDNVRQLSAFPFLKAAFEAQAAGAIPVYEELQ